MRNRIPFLLKKRGARRTGSPVWARAWEALYYAMFVACGAIGFWWTLSDVLLPEWRLAQEAESFEQTTCRVVGARVVSRPGLAEDEYCAELRVTFQPEGLEERTLWTRHGVGRDAPSSVEAEAALRRYQIGELRDCWYDPDDPSRVMLSVRRRWWPWLVLSIPASLFVAGAIGLVRTFVSSQSSPERRSYLWRGGLEATGEEVASTLAPYRKIPAQSAADSPGVRLGHRLPLDGSEGWRVMGMAALCVLWNALAALFVYQLAAGYLSVGGRIGLAAIIVAPLAATGAWMTLSLWRDAGGVSGGGITRLEVDHHPLKAGEPCEAILLLGGPARVRALSVWLVCEEIATYLQGTDSRTATVETQRIELHRERRVEVSIGEPIERGFTIDTPETAAPSFASPHNEVRWSIEVTGGPPNRADWKRRFPLWIDPPDPSPSPEKPQAMEATA